MEAPTTLYSQKWACVIPHTQRRKYASLIIGLSRSHKAFCHSHCCPVSFSVSLLRWIVSWNALCTFGINHRVPLSGKKVYIKFSEFFFLLLCLIYSGKLYRTNSLILNSFILCKPGAQGSLTHSLTITRNMHALTCCLAFKEGWGRGIYLLCCLPWID